MKSVSAGSSKLIRLCPHPDPLTLASECPMWPDSRQRLLIVSLSDRQTDRQTTFALLGLLLEPTITPNIETDRKL